MKNKCYFLKINYKYYIHLYNFTYPFHHANIIRPTIPVPSFNIHVIAAANGVAAASPTPTPCIIECVVRVPIMVLANAYNKLKNSNTD